jgi:hypothetical protein
MGQAFLQGQAGVPALLAPGFFETLRSCASIIVTSGEAPRIPELNQEKVVMQFARRLFTAAALVVGLLVGAAAAQAQATKILPADTEMVLTFNLKQILGSEIAKSNKFLLDLAKGKIQEQLDDKGVAEHLKKADFDLFRDLASVTIGLPGGRDPKEAFIILEGNFDAEKIEKVVVDASKADGTLKVIKIGNVKAFEVTPKDEKTMYVGILDQKIMIVCATKADFTEAVARQGGAKAGAFKSEPFKNLLETINNKQSISFAATSKIMGKLAENNPNAGNDQAKMALAALQQLDGFSAAITIQKNIDFQVGINAKDAETAQKFAAMANGGLIVAKAKVAEQAKQNEKFVPVVEIVNSLRANATGPNLVVTGQITFETLTELLKNLPGNQ